MCGTSHKKWRCRCKNGHTSSLANRETETLSRCTTAYATVSQCSVQKGSESATDGHQLSIDDTKTPGLSPTQLKLSLDMSVPLVLLVGPVLAVSLHSLILRQQEVDHLTLAILIGSSATYVILAYYIHIGPALALYVSFWGSLWLLIAVYRVSFHPLRAYPGPFFARLSKWWVVKQCWDTNLHFHRSQQQLREDYGDYVRTGAYRTFVTVQS